MAFNISVNPLLKDDNFNDNKRLIQIAVTDTEIGMFLPEVPTQNYMQVGLIHQYYAVVKADETTMATEDQRASYGGLCVLCDLEELPVNVQSYIQRNLPETGCETEFLEAVCNDEGKAPYYYYATMTLEAVEAFKKTFC